MRKFSFVAGFTMSIIIVLIMASSCMTTKTDVGEYREMPQRSYNYASGKQVWLFWGVLPLGRTNVKTPQAGNFQLITQYTPGDFLINTLTLGVVRTYTIRVRAKRESPGQE